MKNSFIETGKDIFLVFCAFLNLVIMLTDLEGQENPFLKGFQDSQIFVWGILFSVNIYCILKVITKPSKDNGYKEPSGFTGE
jgi:hypothetical protein